MTVLETKDLGINFGGLQALDDVYLKIEEKEIIGLIGPNGAGKTTVFNLLTGVYTPTKGAIRFEGKSIIGKKPYQINRLGIARTFQNIRLFKNMTVLDNIKAAMSQNMKYSALTAILRLPAYWREERDASDSALELLKLFDMEDTADQLAANLPYGRQRKLEILRALASGPKLLLLDEPAAGMNPTETRELMETIHRIRELFGVSILLIEHDMSLVMGVCERIYVLDYGTLIASGTPEEIRGNEQVIKAYLGG
ncbi:MAG: ABC transporter ATP-binding protein [Clostridiales bacterium]|jgi:branched-chain amino acid transport system ATP-binding protein|nr:ABC transporter ATP-binding protein [Clostridiales bacterium]